MSKSIIVIPADKGKFKVLVCYIQRGIDFPNSDMANTEATRLAGEKHISDIHLYEKATG